MYNSHPKRNKSKYFGELIQMDASCFDFLSNDSKTTLHLAVDDSTNTIVGAYLDKQETLKGYYNVLHQILSNYGIPAKLFTDRRTVFEYKKIDSIKETSNSTNFGYACSQLGIELKTTSIAQSKDLIEKQNDTFQLRLPIDLKLAGIKTIDEANQFLKSYIKKYNDKFAYKVNDSKNCFENQIDVDINVVLGIYNERIINNDNSFKYKNESYFLIDENSKVILPKPKSKILIIEALDKTLYASYEDNLYLTKLIEKNAKYSQEFDIFYINEIKEKKEKEKKKYIPPLTHPWKRSSFNKYKENASKSS